MYRLTCHSRRVRDASGPRTGDGTWEGVSISSRGQPASQIQSSLMDSVPFHLPLPVPLCLSPSPSPSDGPGCPALFLRPLSFSHCPIQRYPLLSILAAVLPRNHQLLSAAVSNAIIPRLSPTNSLVRVHWARANAVGPISHGEKSPRPQFNCLASSKTRTLICPSPTASEMQ